MFLILLSVCVCVVCVYDSVEIKHYNANVPQTYEYAFVYKIEVVKLKLYIAPYILIHTFKHYSTSRREYHNKIYFNK